MAELKSTRPKMLTTQQAAAYLGQHDSTLRGWRMAHSGPAYHRLGPRNFRYLEKDLDAFIADRRYEPPNLWKYLREHR